MEKIELSHQFKLLKSAYDSLKSGVEKKDLSELERDGVVQRFEFTIEITWKTLKKFLQFEGWDSQLFPREIIKEFYKKGIIEDSKLFLDFIDLRNNSSHNYDEEMVNDMFLFIEKNHGAFARLIGNLENLLEKD